MAGSRRCRGFRSELFVCGECKREERLFTSCEVWSESKGSVIDSRCDSALALDLSMLILKVQVKGSFISLKPTHEKV